MNFFFCLRTLVNGRCFSFDSPASIFFFKHSISSLALDTCAGKMGGSETIAGDWEGSSEEIVPFLEEASDELRRCLNSLENMSLIGC
jgi:hypothetical protein